MLVLICDKCVCFVCNFRFKRQSGQAVILASVSAEVTMFSFFPALYIAVCDLHDVLPIFPICQKLPAAESKGLILYLKVLFHSMIN